MLKDPPPKLSLSFLMELRGSVNTESKEKRDTI